MLNLKLWRPYTVALLFLTSCAANATSITFSDDVRKNTTARVLFQFNDDSGNVADHVNDQTARQLETAKSLYDFEGAYGSSVKLVAPVGQEAMQIIVMGLGESDKLGRAEVVAMGGKIAQLFTHKDVQKVDVVVTGLTSKLEHETFAANIAHGISLGSYRFNKYLQEATVPNNDYRVIVKSERKAISQYKNLEDLESGVFLARDLVNTNGAELNPVTFVKAAQDALNGLNVDVKVYDNKQIKEMNMGLLYAVGQGSIPGSRFIVAHYKGSNDKPVALVGKGVTFDTGGYNIKTGSSIARMKGDMAGAAAVLGTIKALAEQEAKVNVIALMPLAENMVSEKALLPGDIITSMSGMSVAIMNTDAEGRLVMADAMWYVQENYEPEIMLNIATLTGAKIRAVGNRYAALFTNDDELLTQLMGAGKVVNEPLWRLPLDYGDKLKINLADTSNIGSGGPGASTAAMFLKQFVQDDTRWAHMDIAGSGSVDATKNEVPAGGVGYGVRTLVEWLTTRN